MIKSGAPEIEKHENQKDDHFQPSDKSEMDVVSLKLIKRAMKVKDLQVAEKIIQKTQRNLNK